MKHQFFLTLDGDVDTSFENTDHPIGVSHFWGGPMCVVCGTKFCDLCHPERLKEECPGEIFNLEGTTVECE